MQLRKRSKNFRNWCPQPSDPVTSKLKHHSASIGAVLVVSLFVATFSVFSAASLFNQPAVQVPIVPISADVQSSNASFVSSSSTIYIKPDGSIDPKTAPIRQVGNVYTLTDNLASDNGRTAIEVQKANVIVDGAGCTLQGHWDSTFPK